MKLCKEEYENILASLKHTIIDSDYSMRELCEVTKKYDPPESIHHSNISQILNQKGRNNLYLQQLLVILKILKIPLEDFLFGRKASVFLRKFRSLPDDKRKKVMQYMKDIS